MNLVLTMAGKYSRFKLFGSKVPKYLLPLATKTVLSGKSNSAILFACLHYTFRKITENFKLKEDQLYRHDKKQYSDTLYLSE